MTTLTEGITEAPTDSGPAASDLQRRLRFHGLLASVVAGRGLTVTIGEGSAAYTDGVVIHLPTPMAPAAHVPVVVQSALLGAGSLDRRVALALLGRPAGARRYLLLEGVRAVQELHHCIPAGVAAEILAHAPDRRSSSRAESLARALADDEVGEAPAMFGVIRCRKLLGFAGGLAEGNDRPPPAVGELDPDPVDEVDEDDDETEQPSRLLKLVADPDRDGPLHRWMQKAMSKRSSLTGEDGATQDTGRVSKRTMRSRLGDTARVVLAGVDQVLGDARPGSSGSCYPEWDARGRRYRPDWCRVLEYDGSSHEVSDPLLPRPTGELRRSLARVGAVPQRRPRQPDGDRLDLEALVDFAVAKSTGEVPDARVYEAMLNTGRDLGVLVLLDASGSTAERNGDDSVWQEHRRMAADLATAFEDLGDRVGVYAFHSQGRQIRFLRMKDFDSRLDATACCRLSALEPSGFTRLGAAIRHASAVLTERSGATRQLLLVVSDGLAFDDGYEDFQAEEDTRRALQEARADGTATACVSVATSTNPAVLHRLWGDVPYGLLARADDLAEHVEPLLRLALAQQARFRPNANDARPHRARRSTYV